MKGWRQACVLALACTSAGALAHGFVKSSALQLPASAASAASAASVSELAEARRVVDSAEQTATPWNGPRTGPPAQPGKHVALVAEDLRNGGILGVVEGVLEAAKIIGWSVKVFDAGGVPALRFKMLTNALAGRPDGLMIVGGDAHAMLSGLLPFARLGIPIVGWHVAAKAGPVPGTPVAMNVSTDPLEVARVTALAAVDESQGHAGVVIFSDSEYRVAQNKADEMAAVIRACSGCTLLDVRDIALSRSEELMGKTTRALLERYGKRWTYALAINDIYFDYAVPVLTEAGLPDGAMAMLSAGDGSESAFLRIRTGTFQTATVAEPLRLHGWQLVDEANRLFAGQPVTGYVFPVHLVTAANIATDGGDRLLYDPANGYRDIYRHIWQRP